MHSKKIVLLLLTATLLVAGSTAVWLYFGDIPKKAPVRAKQVYIPPVLFKTISSYSQSMPAE